jgi:hypothetical protein
MEIEGKQMTWNCYVNPVTAYMLWS